MSTRPSATAKISLFGGVVALLFLAGCGGGAATAKQGVAPGATPGAQTAFRDCLRKNGITLPSGRPSGGFQQSMSPEQRTGFEACRSLRPGGGAFGQNSSAMQAFRSCLKTHGIELPAGLGQGSTAAPAPGATPAPKGGRGPAGGGLRGLKTSDPKVAAALKICQPLRPTATPAP